MDYSWIFPLSRHDPSRGAAVSLQPSQEVACLRRRGPPGAFSVGVIVAGLVNLQDAQTQSVPLAVEYEPSVQQLQELKSVLAAIEVGGVELVFGQWIEHGGCAPNWPAVSWPAPGWSTPTATSPDSAASCLLTSHTDFCPRLPLCFTRV